MYGLSIIAVADDHAARLAVGEFVEIAAHHFFKAEAEATCEHCDEPKDVAEFVCDATGEADRAATMSPRRTAFAILSATSPASAISPKPRYVMFSAVDLASVRWACCSYSVAVIIEELDLLGCICKGDQNPKPPLFPCLQTESLRHLHRNRQRLGR